jgi:hypothetical protein
VAMDGIGLAFSLEDYVAPYLARGALVRICRIAVRRAGFFLYYPSRRQQPAALSALIDTLLLLEGVARDFEEQCCPCRRSPDESAGAILEKRVSDCHDITKVLHNSHLPGDREP